MPDHDCAGTFRAFGQRSGSRAAYIRKYGRANCDVRWRQGARVKPRGLWRARPRPPARGAALRVRPVPWELPAPRARPSQHGLRGPGPLPPALPLRPLLSRLLASPAPLAWKSPHREVHSDFPRPGSALGFSPPEEEGRGKYPSSPLTAGRASPAEAEPWCPAHRALPPPHDGTRGPGRGWRCARPVRRCLCRALARRSRASSEPEFPGRGGAGGTGSSPPAPCQAPHIGWAWLGPAAGARSEAVLFCHKNLNDLNYRYLQFLLEDSQYQYGGVGTLEGTSVLPLGGSSVQK